MSYDGKILSRALEQFEREKQRRAREYGEKQQWIYERSPRIRQINQELQHTVGKIMAQALRQGSDPRAAVGRLQQENLELQRERAELLTELGCPVDFFEGKPGCPRCNDTGYVPGGLCHCLRRIYTREQNRELSMMLDLGNQSFDTFSLDWYSQREDPEHGISPRENMELIYEICSDYAHRFENRTGNLLLIGAPGLGKTFLSACIAREVSDQGFSVVYDTAGHVFSRMEAQKFGREDDESLQEDVSRYLKTDLLILDDLGTELTTGFVVSALYQLINSRLMSGAKTILSTNLSMDEIGKRYGAAIRSRLEGEYRMLPFFGRDIRLLKRGE